MTTQERVKEIRKATGLNMKRFAAKYGIPYRTVQNWEAGTASAPEYVLDLLAKAVEAETVRKMDAEAAIEALGDFISKSVNAGEVENEWTRAITYRHEWGDGWAEIEVSFVNEHDKYYPLVVAEAARLGGIIMKTDVFTKNTVIRFYDNRK